MQTRAQHTIDYTHARTHAHAAIFSLLFALIIACGIIHFAHIANWWRLMCATQSRSGQIGCSREWVKPTILSTLFAENYTRMCVLTAKIYDVAVGFVSVCVLGITGIGITIFD